MRVPLCSSSTSMAPISATLQLCIPSFCEWHIHSGGNPTSSRENADDCLSIESSQKAKLKTKGDLCRPFYTYLEARLRQLKRPYLHRISGGVFTPKCLPMPLRALDPPGDICAWEINDVDRGPIDNHHQRIRRLKRRLEYPSATELTTVSHPRKKVVRCS